MLGQMLAQVFADDDLVLTDREEMDVTDLQKTLKVISQSKPDIIIHAAAYVNVDEAEDEPEVCRRINVEGTRNVAIAAEEIKAKLFYISTDYVFDGKKSSPYLEEDRANPLGVYGQSKLDGEGEIAKICSKYITLRVAWLFGESKSGKNFVETMINLGKSKPELRVINDQIGSPTYTRDLAKTIKLMIKKSPPYGTYNFSGETATTRYEFCKEIFKQLKIKTPIEPIQTKDFNAKAKRPPYSYLSKTKIESALNIKVRPWQQMLKDYLSRRGC